MTAKETRVPYDSLIRFVGKIFEEGGGCTVDDARTMAECLVQTNLWGIDGHGVIRVPIYLERFRNGAMNKRPRIRTLRSEGALEVLDADNSAGYIAGRAAMKRAIELAREKAVSAVGIINSNHCGATALYARMAAEEGMVGIAMTNVAPNMSMPGVRKSITGNNPIAVAVPTFGDFPFCLDISLSAVAGGKLIVAAKNGEEIPLGWATDKDGNPTTDAQAGFEGFLLPVGAHKGFGLSLMVDILCGVMTGGAFQDHLKGMYKYPGDPSATAHLMLVINPQVLMSKEQLKQRMTEFVATLKDTPVNTGAPEILIPGELEYRVEQERKSEGIPLPAAVFEDLVRIGNEIDRSI
ncbi:MAG: Ldh family oxidoreductase [Xanthomonadales bacterium]|jgi:LDH2 family malate/lactate/ureidoglycolate dehydrogenase|nr:Ldh family oxidoreductase [Xanthomonadales bacterium]